MYNTDSTTANEQSLIFIDDESQNNIIYVFEVYCILLPAIYEESKTNIIILYASD